MFIEAWKVETNGLLQKIEASRGLLPEISALDTHMEYAAEIASEGNCHGHRAEIVLIETAKAIAAFEGRKGMLKEDIAEAARFVLPHRIREKRKVVDGREQRSDKNHSNESCGEQDQQAVLTQEQKPPSGEKDTTGAYQEREKTYLENTLQTVSNQCNEKIDKLEDIFEISLSVDQMTDKRKRRGSGRKNKTITDSGQGRYIRYTFPKGKAKSIAFDASLRAAAPYQITRDKKGMAIAMKASDLREKVCEKRTGATILFVVDASGSMGAGKRMGTVKGTILSLLNDAYQKRDKVGMIAFRKNGAEVLLDITRSVNLAQKRLKELPTGGKTPLASGLYKAYELLRAAKRKDPNIFPLLVLLSDGRANVSLNGEDAVKEAFDAAKCIASEGIKSLVIDTECGRIRFGLASEISSHLGATYHKIDNLTDCKLEQAVRNILI
ncbi:magnesium chelatase subunit D [Geosporobacter subterraneus DSM 17957]|uniref:Magnesium chelatase subunit D n=1 Tax=Geosporobacter subterraneus DSM 17957 TaxID=1121919 RepID=A0A1M6Q5B7_9FIRM|nr:VWA domain-containing protein [Geosporobacter subterraneus]SHK15385.1 magnesium chelatase subunit D [Geosporobacter subterraneus DSM 17957]